MRFSPEQVKFICGGKLPHGNGFAWNTVEYFWLENGVFQPYHGKEILPGPRIRINTTLEDNPCIWLIQGMFFAKSTIPGISYGSGVGTVATMNPVVVFSMFMGMFGQNHGKMTGKHGVMSDKYGESVLDPVVLGTKKMTFVKTYEGKEPIHYSFHKGEDGIWTGSFRGKETGKGVARCVVTPVPMEFSMPPEL